MYMTKKVDQGVWIIEESTALDSLTIAEGASLAAPEGKSLTMTVDGIGMAIKPGIYKGNIYLTVNDAFFVLPGGLQKGQKAKKFRTAILIEDGRYVAEKSVPAIVQGGKVTDKAITGVTIQGTEDNFNGIFITGNTEYTIDNVKIDFEGNGGNDFIAYGAGIACTGNTRLTINNSDIQLKSITRCGFHAGGNTVTTLNNCRITNVSPGTDKMNPTWMLGFRGSNRSTQHCDYATVYYNDCYLLCNGWGTLGVDGGVVVRIYCKNSTIDLKGPRARGYGAFSIGDCFVSYDGCTLNVQGYPLLIGGGAGMPGNQKSDGAFTGGTIVNSTLYGVMIFRCEGTELKVDKGTVFNTASSVFVVKGANAFINTDNAVLNPANGVIMQLMDNDEPGMGPNRFLVPIGEVDVPIPGRDLTVADPKEDVFMTVSNMEVSGDFYNSTTNLKAHCRDQGSSAESDNIPNMMGMMERDEPEHGHAEGPPSGGMKIDAEALQGVKNFDLKFANARVNGVISAATTAYKDGLTIIDARNNKELSNVKQTAHEPVNNGVIVSFDKDSIWMVTGTAYLTSLTIARGAVIKAAGGKTLTMTVNGVKMDVGPGTYTGKIVMMVA